MGHRWVVNILSLGVLISSSAQSPHTRLNCQKNYKTDWRTSLAENSARRTTWRRKKPARKSKRRPRLRGDQPHIRRVSHGALPSPVEATVPDERVWSTRKGG